MKDEFQRLPLQVPRSLTARLMRIAIARQSTAKRALPALGREALNDFAVKQEEQLRLAPITAGEIEELLKAEPKAEPQEEAKAA